MIPRRFFWLLDLSVLVAAFALTYAVWPHIYEWLARKPSVVAALRVLRPMYGHVAVPGVREMAWIIAFAAPSTILFLALSEAHDALLRQSRTRIVAASFGAPLMSAALLTLVAFAFQRAEISRVFIFVFTLLSGIGLCCCRLGLRAYMERRRDAGFYAKGVLLIGPPDVVLGLVNHFRERVSSKEYKLEGYLTDLEAAGATAVALRESGLTPFGPISRVGDLLIHEPIHEVIAVQASSGSPWMRQVIDACDSLGVLLRIIPENLLFGKTRTLHNHYPYQILHLPAVVLAPPHFDSDALFIKRVLDIIISAALLALLSPLFAVIAILIKLSDPKAAVFYRWNVVGRNGVRFTGYKFTTMCHDADERRRELLDKNEMSGPVFKIKDDPRVTPIGRLLRKYSLNELPQLWSVLKGDMSLVGPRPAFPHELEKYGFWHKRKLSIRPGITCLWQVRGRNRISNFDDWVKLDLEYIDNWSLWLDFKILVRTAWAVVAGSGS